MIADYSRKMRLFQPDARLFLVAGMMAGIAWDGIRLVLLNLYLLRLGYGAEFVGLFNAVGAIAYALASPLAGVVGSRWSSRGAILLGLGVMAAAHAALPLAEVLPAAPARVWLLVMSALTYVGSAQYLVNSVPFMMDATGLEERNHFFSVHMALVPLAAFAGSLLAGALPGMLAGWLHLSLGDPAPYRYPLWLAALLFFAGLATLGRTRTAGRRLPPLPASAATEDRAPVGVILVFGLVIALRFGGRSIGATFFNVYLDDGLGVSTALIGVIAAAGQLLSVPLSLAAPPLLARWGTDGFLLRGIWGMSLSLLPVALVPHWLAAGVGFAGLTALFSATIGSVRLFSQEVVAPRWRTTSAAAFMTGGGVGNATVSLAGGYAIAALGYQPLFLAAAGLVAASGLLFEGYFRRWRGGLGYRTLASAD